MFFDMLLFPPPELRKNRSTQTWTEYTVPRRQFPAIDAQRGLRLAAFQQSPVFRRDFVQHHSLFDVPQPTRASQPMTQSDDFVRAAGQEMVAAFRALTTTVPTALPPNNQSAPSASSVPPRNIITATHQFLAPATMLQPRLNLLPPLPVDPYALYGETAMFQWAEQLSITNWAGATAQQLQYSDYRSRVQLCNTQDRPFQLNDEVLFLHSTQHRLDPSNPWATLCYMFQLQYRVVHIQNDIMFSDFVEFFSAPMGSTLDVTTITLQLRCTYNGTYLLRISPMVLSKMRLLRLYSHPQALPQQHHRNPPPALPTASFTLQFVQRLQVAQLRQHLRQRQC